MKRLIIKARADLAFHATIGGNTVTATSPGETITIQFDDAPLGNSYYVLYVNGTPYHINNQRNREMHS